MSPKVRVLPFLLILLPLDFIVMVSLLIASALLLIAFLVVERRTTHPMFDLSLFRKPTFTGASTVAFVLSASIFAMFLYLVLYMQNVLDFTPFEAGLRFLPLSLLSFVAAAISGRATARVPVAYLMGGGLPLDDRLALAGT